MDVLALNPGSSSLRFQVVAVEPAGGALQARRLGGGSIAGIGAGGSASARDHLEALEAALDRLRAGELVFGAIGVRLVGGGHEHGEAARLDAALLETLREAGELAPLHDRPALQMIERLLARTGGSVPIAAVFDSGFHAGLPEVARSYALPWELGRRHGIRRLGFHGIALRSVVEQLRAQPGGLPRRVVAAHLGSGCSVSALLEGRSIDTSMGFTPLEGLMMATRSGDLDPSLVAHLARVERRPPEEIVELLNTRSGLLGVSGTTGDMREIERLCAGGDRRATLAFELFVHRAKKHLAGMLAVLGGADALVFSGGIGENSAAVRAALCSGMQWCGLELDLARNSAARCGERISRDGSRVAVHVIGADEESWIARAAFERLARSAPGS